MDSRKVAQDRNDGGLSPTTAENSPGRSRAASVKSNRSGTTIVEDDHHNGEEDYKSATQFSRTGTLDITIKPVSRLEMFYGLFSPEKMTRKIAEKAKVNGVDNYEYKSSRESPYIVSVHALSKRKDENKHFVPKPARCTIDTGNHQGNFVSKSYLMEDLEYSESDFLSLNSSERNGGLSASNHKLMPEAAVIITWYHSGSTRLFRNMRFLIMSNPQYDLVIGARSIAKHNLLSPPNFGAEGIVVYTANTDKELTNLKAKEKQFKNDILSLKYELGKLENDTPSNYVDIEEKKAKIAEKETQAKDAAKDLKEYYEKQAEQGGQTSQKNVNMSNGTAEGHQTTHADNAKAIDEKGKGKASTFGILRNRKPGGKK